MTLYREIEESKRVYPAEQAIQSFRNVTEIAADLVRSTDIQDNGWEVAVSRQQRGCNSLRNSDF